MHEGLLGALFEGVLLEEVEVGGGLKGVVPSIKGSAWVTQHSNIFVDQTDPFPTGYTLGDIWG